MKLFRVLLFLIAIGLPLSAIQNSWALESGLQIESLSYFEDRSSKLSFGEVLQKEKSHEIQFVKANNPLALGYTSSRVWVRTPVKNNSLTQKDWRIVFDESTFDRVDFYVFGSPTDAASLSGNALDFQSSGSVVPYESRPLKRRGIVFSLSIPPGQSRELLYSFRSNHLMAIHPEAMTPEAFDSRTDTISFAYTFYYGAVLAIFFYNLFLWGMTRRSTYLYYCFFEASVGLLYYLGCMDFGDWLTPIKGGWTQYHPYVRALTLFSTIVFVYKYLKIPEFLPKVGWVFKLLGALLIVSTVPMVFVDKAYFGKIYDPLTLVTLLFSLIAAGFAVKRGSREAKYFLWSWVPLVVGVTIMMSGLHGMMTRGHLVTALAVPIGSILEMVILAVGLGDQLRWLELLKAEVASRTEAQRRLAESQQTLIENSKLTALGQMAGGIAHEINNPLTIIYSSLELISHHVSQVTPDTDAIDRLLKNSKKTIMRISSIIRSLRTISRNGAGDPFVEEDLTSIALSTLDLCREKFKYHAINLQVEGLDQPIPILCRAVQVSQILLNLLNNAFDEIQKVQNPQISILATKDLLRNRVTVEIRNNGPKISSDIASKVFDPFFTTKEVGKGTGLGLTISRTFANEHQGDLKVDLVQNETCFILELPLMRESRQMSYLGKEKHLSFESRV